MNTQGQTQYFSRYKGRTSKCEQKLNQKLLKTHKPCKKAKTRLNDITQSNKRNTKPQNLERWPRSRSHAEHNVVDQYVSMGRPS